MKKEGWLAPTLFFIVVFYSAAVFQLNSDQRSSA
jgi:hypothetical protein